MISKFIDNLWRPRRNKHHRRQKRVATPLAATEKLEDRTLLSGQDLVAFAQALTAANVTLYGAAWDADSTAQKALFEDGAQFLNFVEVTDANRELNSIATTEGITVLPTWKLANGSLVEGIQSLQELATATGIAIPISEGPFLKEIADQNFLSGTALHVALDGFDPDNGPLTYTVESSNESDIQARILTGNRSLRISVEGYGDMVFELFEGRATRAAEHIIQLAEEGFYDASEFFRIFGGFIRGGDPSGVGNGGSYLGPIDDQFHAELQHVQSGLLTLYKPSDTPGVTYDDKSDSQFIITNGPIRNYDFQNTIFGYLVEGEEVREALSHVPVTANVPNFTITMETVEVFTDQENATLVLTSNENTTASSTITVTVRDQDGNTQVRQFQVNVTPDTVVSPGDVANASPYLADIPALQVRPGESVQYQLDAIDIDLAAPNSNSVGDIKYYNASRLIENGLAVPAPTPSGMTYQLDQHTGLLTIPSAPVTPGVYKITVAAGFALELIDYQVITVIVTDSPVANNDFVALQGNTPAPITILTNDTDSDGTIDVTSVEIVSQPTHGTVTTNANGTVNYVADGSGYIGLGSFTYRVKDNFGAYSNVATVNFSIAPTGVILVTTLGSLTKLDGLITLNEAVYVANNDLAFDSAPAGNGHDIIMFDPALFNDSPKTITLSNQLTVSDSLTIIAPTSAEGNPLLTLDINQGARHFSISDLSANTILVGLQNLILINGKTSNNGGSIYNAEHLVITNCDLLNNQTTAGLGGAIYNTGTLEISNSLFQSNSTSGFTSGGAIASLSGSVTLNQTIIDNNSAGDSGGGIYASNTDVTLTDTLFTANSSIFGAGGGLFQSSGQLTITNSSFTDNSTSSTADGGGVYALDATTEISGSTFHLNQSSGSGGGLNQQEGTLSIRNSTFSGNTALSGHGGGIQTGAVTFSMVNSTISGNSANQDGGGIYFADVFNFSSGIIHNSTIANNHADGNGGGLHSPLNTITAYNTIIADNTVSGSGADVLGQLNGSFNLIENPAGLTNQGSNFITGQDPGLLPLADNGGLTQTHALTSGSVAIDAGNPAFNPNTFTPALNLDQRGSARVADGNNDSTSRIDIGAYEAESILGSVDLTVKWQATTVGAAGNVSSLPANANFIDEWNPVVVEIWVRVTNSSENGVTAASVDFNFDAQYLQVSSIEYGPGYTQNQTGTIDNEAGTITGLGAATSQTNHGAETLVLLARVRLSVKAIPLNTDGHYIEPVGNLNFHISNSTLASSLGDVAVTEGADTNLTLVPALFDLNDSGVIDIKDLLILAAVYNKKITDPNPEYVWAADFNRSGRVDYLDLVLFVSNFQKVKGSGVFFNYPPNFDDVWQQDYLITSLMNQVESNSQSLTNEQVEPVLESAKDQLAEVHGDSVYEQLANVKIQIVELPQNQLAKADTNSNTIYLDANAAGWGWFVDQTPRLNEEFSSTTVPGIFAAELFRGADGQIDLLTVLIHELNHLLGYEHDPANAFMEPDLNPGERKLPSLEKSTETDDFFGSYLDSEFHGIN
tara:strand:- start:24598 stop:29190 length:4593 start_codon:yes stop_codon:yes gene_type:complete